MSKVEAREESPVQNRQSGEVRKQESGAPPFVERRTEPRFLVDADVLFASEVQELQGTTCDVSVGGACIAAYRVLPVRTPVTVKLKLPQGMVLCQAEIRWVRPARTGLSKMGMRFIGLSQLDKSLLLNFVDDADVIAGPVSSRR